MAKFTKRQMTDWLTAMEAAKRDGLQVNETDYASGAVIERLQPTIGLRYAEVVGFQSAADARFELARMFGFSR